MTCTVPCKRLSPNMIDFVLEGVGVYNVPMTMNTVVLLTYISDFKRALL
jgi:hypothetical protein